MLHHFASTLPNGQPIVATQSDAVPNFGAVVYMECPSIEVALFEAHRLNQHEKSLDDARAARIMAASHYAGPPRRPRWFPNEGTD